MAHIRQSKPVSCLGFQLTLHFVVSLLGSWYSVAHQHLENVSPGPQIRTPRQDAVDSLLLSLALSLYIYIYTYIHIYIYVYIYIHMYI